MDNGKPQSKYDDDAQQNVDCGACAGTMDGVIGLACTTRHSARKLPDTTCNAPDRIGQLSTQEAQLE